MRRGLQLGKIFGIPFQLDYSWFIIFFIITTSLSLLYFPDRYPDWATAQYWIVGIATSFLFFASVATHELAHSVVGLRNGIPVKSITLFIFGGVAHIGREATHPATELRMAAAGPLCSLVLAGLFYGLFWISQDFSVHLAALAWWLALINGMLAVFNMIPGFPLDGGRVLRSITWMITANFRQATRIATFAGYGVSYLFILGGIFFMFFLVGGWFNGLWFIFIGFFLNSANRTSYRQTMAREDLKGFSAKDVMLRDLPQIRQNTTIKEVIQGQPLLPSIPCFLVADGERMAGFLTLGQIKQVPREQWDLTTVGQAMTPVEQVKAVRPSDDAVTVLEQMEEENLNLVAVVGEGRFWGIILRDVLIQFALSLQEPRH